MISLLKLWDAPDLQSTANTGFVIPFDSDANSSAFFASTGLSLGLTEWLFPTVEVNYFRVVNDGDGGRRFDEHIDGQLPSLVTFEGGDLVNWGASNGEINRNIVTLGLGVRVRPTKRLDFGFGWEFPLTTKEENLMDNRFTFDCIWRF